MRIVASLLTAWVAFRWLGLLAGLLRIRRLDPSLGREARRAAVSHVAIDVFLSVSGLYAWAYALRLQPVDRFVGLMAAVLMLSLVTGVLAWFMQPEERSPEVWRIFRFRR